MLLVLAGGKGTIQTVAESIRRKTPVVLVKESGGAAQALLYYYVLLNYYSTRLYFILYTPLTFTPLLTLLLPLALRTLPRS